ncbi:MAG: hypothetical protein GQ569_12590 [Methylococcaceae bacterium]|nr:hypothetical protein [Methylococcaceae bacterium]
MQAFQEIYLPQIELFIYGTVVIVIAIGVGLLIKAIVNFYELNELTSFPSSKFKKAQETHFISNGYYLLTIITVIAIFFTPKIIPKESLEFVVYRLWSIMLLLTATLRVAHYLSNELLVLFENTVIQEKLNQWFYGEKETSSKDNLAVLTAHLSGLFIYMLTAAVGGFVAIVAVLNSKLLVLLMTHSGKLLFFIILIALIAATYYWFIKLPASPYHKPFIAIFCLLGVLELSGGSFIIAFLFGVAAMFYLKDNIHIADVIAGWFLIFSQRKQALVNNKTVTFEQVGFIETTVTDSEGTSQQPNCKLLVSVVEASKDV